MRCLVVGAGAWGLPAATELARRGHDVVLIDRFGIANPWASSTGPSRMWRLTHPDAVRVRLGARAVEAMRRLERLTGRTVMLQRGLLWRDDVSVPSVLSALADCGVEHELVAAADVGRFFPGLRPDGRDAVWQADAGPVLAEEVMAGHAHLFAEAGGSLEVGPTVVDVDRTGYGVSVHCAEGRRFEADALVLAAGPGAQPLLDQLGVELPLRPHLEQVVHVQPADDLPCLFDGPGKDEPALYALPTPGIGYKIGLDAPMRDWTPDDRDRTPDPDLTRQIVDRATRDFASLDPRVVDATVCSWTDSPDQRFVIDVLPGGVVLACGDSGEGFKFSALMGTVLADLAEGAAPDEDIAGFGLARFADGLPTRSRALGR